MKILDLKDFGNDMNRLAEPKRGVYVPKCAGRFVVDHRNQTGLGCRNWCAAIQSDQSNCPRHAHGEGHRQKGQDGAVPWPGDHFQALSNVSALAIAW